MTASQLRKKLHIYIDNAKEKKLKAIYTMVESEIEAPSLLTTAQKKELDKRLIEYRLGEGKTYTWKEAKEAIYNKGKRATKK